MVKEKLSKEKIWLGLFLLSVVLNIAVIFTFLSNRRVIDAANNLNDQVGKYPLLSKRILQEFPQDILINFLDLRKELRSQVAPYGKDFGFYFEYLPTGTSIGVNEKEEFHAASLFKVPVVMAYYKQRERLQMTNDPEVEIKEEHLDNEFGTLYRKGVGHKIKLSEAVKLALEDSDNTAARLVATNVKETDFNEVYSGIDIDLMSDEDGAIMTAKNYSSILKALYFSAVLGKDSSSEILDYLTKSEFNDKLAAGVPPGVPVAHKIGDFVDKETGDKAYMDCGIVYIPRRPYLLCMVSMTDEATASQRMSNLSKKVYDYVSKIE